MGTPEQMQKYFGLETTLPRQAKDLDAIVLINAHDAFRGLKLNQLKKMLKTPVVIDIKNFFDREAALKMGLRYVCL